MRMAWPIITGSLSYAFMQFFDQVMVSKYSDTALAAVPIAGLAVFTLSTFILGVVGCVSTFVSQSLGRGEKENCAKYTWQGIYVSLVTGVVALVLWPLAEPLFGLFPHSPEVRELEVTYFQIRLFGFVFIAWQAALSSFFQSVNRPRVPMWTAFYGNLLNIVLNLLLIFGYCGFPRLGVAGAAIATVIAQLVQTAMLQWVFMNAKTHAEFGTRTSMAVDRQKIRELMRIGWPGGLSFFMDVANWSVFSMVIVGYFGDTALKAHNAAIAFMHMSFLPAVGLNQAIAPIVGQWIGRNDIPRAKSRTYTAMRIAIVYMATVGTIMAIFGKPLIRAFFTTDPEVVAMGHTLLILAALFQAFDGVNIVMFGALRGAGDTRWMLMMTIVFGYGYFIPLSLLFAFVLNLGAVGAWYGATIFIVTLSGVVYWRFQGERWRKVRIFASDYQDSQGDETLTPPPLPESPAQPE
ncbi:MAG: MATE family efflux transporter [bacterium]|nr:MATE family efflux transporter [bacterium]